MLYVDKTITENPFVDNVAYYAKLLALNCSVKDSEEALANETAESMKAGYRYIACIEGNATYELFDSFPVSILQNYIPQGSNLDIYSKNPKWLKIRLENLDEPTRTATLNRLSKLARTVYIDHYDTMTKYIQEIGPTWLADHEELYNKCMDGTATYLDLFDELPMKTCLRIIRSYLNSHGYMDLAALWDPDSVITKADLAKLEATIKASGDSTYNSNIKNLLLDTDYVASVDGYSVSQSNYMNQFLAYISTRDDDTILTELANISKAMREVFISHYEVMQDRNYFNSGSEDNIATVIGDDGTEFKMPIWYGYSFSEDLYKKCKKGTVEWEELYPVFPQYEIKSALDEVLGSSIVEAYELMTDQVTLESYLVNYCEDGEAKAAELDESMTSMYLANYQFYLNKDIYFDCKYGSRTIYDLYDYLPVETLKSIINTEFPETNSLQIFAANKNMLNSYLGTLDAETAQDIKDKIAADMMKWYPYNHVEKNNYYRAYLGLPPIDSKGNIYEDTLVRTYDADSKTFTEFDNTFVNMCPTDVYPASHWKNELYTYDTYDIGILKDAGVIDAYVEEGCKASLFSNRYKYLRYLGDEKLDLYTMRKAENFALIGLPSVDDQDIRNKFIEAFGVNREYVIRCVYADAYKFQSDYYNNFMILFIIINTMIDCVTSISNYIINRDVFDARCVQYLFESFGIPYYSEIPLKYQKAMLKNLNILIKYKSSTKNMIDICRLFGYSDIQIFGYYMMKSRLKSSNGDYIPEEDNDIDYDLDDVYVKYSDGSVVDITGRKFCKLSEYPNYNEDYYMKTVSIMNDDGTIESKKVLNNERELYVYDSKLEQMIPLKESTYFKKIKANTAPSDIKFIKVPIGASVADYKGNDENIESYEDITDEETWDGGLDHNYLKQKIMDYAFNAVKSKYISLDATVNLTEIAFQTSYFYNMLFDSAYGENALTLQIPEIKVGHTFRLTDVIFFLFAISYYYQGLKDKIMYSPTQILYVKGYNFQDVVNDVFQNERFFAQIDSSSNALTDAEKEDCFDINTEIAKRSYNYRETFTNAKLKVKGFNLNADIDALEKWLNEEWQMSLDDFVVSEDGDSILTLRQFYSLNNSYYQKDIFNGLMTPMPYNNLIKYAYDHYIIGKVSFQDLNYVQHWYLPEAITIDSIDDTYGFVTDVVAAVSKNLKSKSYNELMERIKTVSSYEELSNYAYLLRNIFVVTDTANYESIISSMTKTFYNLILEPDDVATIYVLNSTTYGKRISSRDTISVPLYNKYTKDSEGNYQLIDPSHYYYYDKTNDEYQALISGLIYVKNMDGVYTFGADAIYEMNTNGEYIEIDYNSHTTYDPETNAQILNFGDYFIRSSTGEWILNPNNCYIKVRIDGIEQYILLKDLEDYTEVYISKDDCFVETDGGHFIKFRYTDYYIRTHNDTPAGNEMEYVEQSLYVAVDYETGIYDASLDEVDRVYYKKLDDYLADGFAISTETLYVKNPDGIYLPETSILNPANTWYWDNISQSYRLVLDDQFSYLEYENPLNVLYIMVLHGNYDYYKYALEAATGDYKLVETTGKRYVYNSNTNYITVLNTVPTYDDTSSLSVVLNLSLTEDVVAEAITGYNPSLNDGKWDENDWYYGHEGSDSDIVIGMNGENIWYYRKPGSTNDSTSENDEESILGSGFYLPAESYIGSTEIEEGIEYYLSMDIMTNFNGAIQIVCMADPVAKMSTERNYTVESGVSLHINQTFTAASSGSPQIRIIKYNFSTNPIHIGDIVKVSNLKIMKSYSEHYVPADIPTVSMLADIYKTNRSIYKWLLTQMHKIDDKRMYDIYQKLYDSLMVSEYNKEIFKLSDGTYATTYTDFLRTRDTTLAGILDNLKLMKTDTMRNAISQYVIDICYELSLYLAELNLEYLYSHFPGMGVTFIQQYLFKVINWFKSWKVHLLGINTVYRMGNGTITDENGQVIADVTGSDFMIKLLHDKRSSVRSVINLKDGFLKDVLKINPLDDVSPDGTPYADKYDLSDVLQCLDDHVPLHHRIRIMTTYGDQLRWDEKNNRVLLDLKDDSTKVRIENGNELIVETTNGDVFEASDGNKLVIFSDADSQEVYSSQVIDEINLLSGDYVEKTLEEEDDDDE